MAFPVLVVAVACDVADVEVCVDTLFVASVLSVSTVGGPPSPSLALPHPPSPSLTLPHPPSPSLTLPHPPSPSLTLPHPPSPSLTLPHPPSPSLTLPHPPSPSLSLPQPPSASLSLPKRMSCACVRGPACAQSCVCACVRSLAFRNPLSPSHLLRLFSSSSHSFVPSPRLSPLSPLSSLGDIPLVQLNMTSQTNCASMNSHDICPLS